MAYHTDYDVSSFNVVSRQDARMASPFAAALCVAAGDVAAENSPDMSQVEAAALFGLDRKEVLYARNIHERLHPASLTKVLTALVALENGQLGQTLTATNAVNVTESGAVLCGLKSGDTMTLDQALRILLVYSANDAAMLIAENIGGSVEHFVEMMNEKAHALGATNSHFTNPHGLTDSDHYTTAYDLYLIFNAAVQYDTFNEIIHMSGYQTVFYDKDGKEKAFDKSNSNKFLQGAYQAPANVTVIGGKTGTTSAAGNCLILLSRDENGSPYISVILRAEDPDVLYGRMVDLLDEIHK
jgi:D-alanyl-D-alanine carboxypeptidase